MSLAEIIRGTPAIAPSAGFSKRRQERIVLAFTLSEEASMNIAIVGATGNVGSRIVNEALSRGHEVIAISRSADQLPAKPRLTTKALDYTDAARLAAAIAGQDAVVIAVKYSTAHPATIVEAVKKAGVKRLLAVGGAGSLRDPGGRDVVDSPDFPAPWKPEALAARDFLVDLRKEPALNWTLLSPSALLQPGERTAKYRVGADDLLVDAQGNSHVSIEDLAKALIDELEVPKHERKRFTVGY
jgi:putative NADH-flavin reductase